MDPVTQGVLGVCAAQNVANKEQVVKDIATLSVVGCIAAMSPDLDVLIRSNHDPLLFLEYHRQFTHSLFFIPFGGFIVSVVLYVLFAKKRGLSFKATFLFSIAGYSTHALLDACTTYGTMLLWPFSDMRVAWNTIAVVDPFYTLPLLALAYLAFKKQNKLFAQIAIVYIVFYPTLGLVQKHRAEAFARSYLFNERQLVEGEFANLIAKPSIGNLWVWKIVYEKDNYYFVDAVRISATGKYFVGDKVKKFDLETDLPWLKEGTQQYEDLQRFNWFSNGYIALSPEQENSVIDVRYSRIPNQIKPLWLIEFDPQAEIDAHVNYVVDRKVETEDQDLFWEMLRG